VSAWPNYVSRSCLPGRCGALTRWPCQTATTSSRPRRSSSPQAPARTAIAIRGGHRPLHSECCCSQVAAVAWTKPRHVCGVMREAHLVYQRSPPAASAPRGRRRPCAPPATCWAAALMRAAFGAAEPPVPLPARPSRQQRQGRRQTRWKPVARRRWRPLQRGCPTRARPQAAGAQLAAPCRGRQQALCRCRSPGSPTPGAAPAPAAPPTSACRRCPSHPAR
jgi:hypothetical protein